MTRAILIVDHGSRLEQANRLLDAVASALRERLPGRIVRGAHLELAPPLVAEAIDACVAEGAREILLAPWFLAPGAHTSRDLPRLAAEAEARHPGLRVACAEPLGLHEKLVDVLLERIGGR